jgi:hypothetical protein
MGGSGKHPFSAPDKNVYVNHVLLLRLVRPWRAFRNGGGHGEDVFHVENGEIVEQENHYDPRASA